MVAVAGSLGINHACCAQVGYCKGWGAEAGSHESCKQLIKLLDVADDLIVECIEINRFSHDPFICGGHVGCLIVHGCGYIVLVCCWMG